MKYTHARGLSYYSNAIYRECNNESSIPKLDFGHGQVFVDGSGNEMGSRLGDYDFKGATQAIVDRYKALDPDKNMTVDALMKEFAEKGKDFVALLQQPQVTELSFDVQ